MTVESISLSISRKVWDRAGIELATPGYAVRHASVARHVTDCPTRPGIGVCVCCVCVWCVVVTVVVVAVVVVVVTTNFYTKVYLHYWLSLDMSNKK